VLRAGPAKACLRRASAAFIPGDSPADIGAQFEPVNLHSDTIFVVVATEFGTRRASSVESTPAIDAGRIKILFAVSRERMLASDQQISP